MAMYQFVGVEGLVTAIQDTFPTLRKTAKRKASFVAVVVFIHFLVGLPMCTRVCEQIFKKFKKYETGNVMGYCFLFVSNFSKKFYTIFGLIFTCICFHGMPFLAYFSIFQS